MQIKILEHISYERLPSYYNSYGVKHKKLNCWKSRGARVPISIAREPMQVKIIVELEQVAAVHWQSEAASLLPW